MTSAERLLLEAKQARIKAQQSGKGFTELRSLKELARQFLPEIQTSLAVPADYLPTSDVPAVKPSTPREP